MGQCNLGMGEGRAEQTALGGIFQVQSGVSAPADPVLPGCSPLYHWVTWMDEHLPPDQKRLYLALHEHLRDEPRRQAIMAKAQYVSGVHASAAC